MQNSFVTGHKFDLCFLEYNGEKSIFSLQEISLFESFPLFGVPGIFDLKLGVNKMNKKDYLEFL